MDAQQYPDQFAEELARLVARARALGAFDVPNEHLADLDSEAERLIDLVDPTGTLSRAPRCSVCAELLDVESWDTPTLYCPNDCDIPEPERT